MANLGVNALNFHKKIKVSFKFVKKKVYLNILYFNETNLNC